MKNNATKKVLDKQKGHKQIDINLDKNRKVKEFAFSRIADDEPTPKNKTTKEFIKSPVKATKSPTKLLNKSVQNLINPRLYRPYENSTRLFEQKKKNIYDEMQNPSTFRITNPQSYFLNEKNPKPPIYERAQQIMKRRQIMLQQQRQKQARKRQQQKAKQDQQNRQMQSYKGTIKKEEAYEITNKLYKDYYVKTYKMNQLKLELQKEQARHYRDKPQMNQNSKDIYQLILEKNKIQADIIDRFKDYDQQKKIHLQQIQAKISHKYYPFKPNVSPGQSQRKEHPSSSPKKRSKSTLNLQAKQSSS